MGNAVKYDKLNRISPASDVQRTSIYGKTDISSVLNELKRDLAQSTSLLEAEHNRERSNDT